MRIGVRAHDLGKDTADLLAEKVAARGLKCVQLTLHEAIEGMDGAAGRLNPGLAYEIGAAFRKRDVQIAVLSCYINPIHPDEGERAKQIELFKEHLRFVRDFGCGIVATETGSVNLLSMDNYPERDRIIEDSFDLFGDRIAAVHAKDLRVEAGRMISVPLGKGLMNYKLLLGLLKRRKPSLNVVIEDTSPDTIDLSMQHLKDTWQSA